MGAGALFGNPREHAAQLEAGTRQSDEVLERVAQQVCAPQRTEERKKADEARLPKAHPEEEADEGKEREGKEEARGHPAEQEIGGGR